MKTVSRARSPFTITAAVVGGLIALLTTVVAPVAAQDGINAEQRAALYARPAVVYLEHTWDVRVSHDLGRLPVEYTNSCTGFVVEENGYIVTAGHCVDPSPNGAGQRALNIAVDTLRDEYPELSRQELLSYAEGNWEIEGLTAGSSPTPTTLVYQAAAISGLRTNDAWPARVIEFQASGQGDVALLKSEQRKLSTIELRPASEIDIGLPVLSIGYPGSVSNVTDFNFEPTFKDGRISSTKTQFSYPVFEVSAALSQGMSGGPTVDLDGRVVGVNSFGPRRESQAFNFLSSVDLVNEMLSRNGVIATPSPIDASYRAGVDEFLAGNHSAAIAHFDDVLDRSPSHSQSAELRVQAQDALAGAPTSSGIPTLPVAIAIAVVAAIAIGFRSGVFTGVRQRRGVAPSAASTTASQLAPHTWAPHATATAPAHSDHPAPTGWWSELPTTSRADS